MILSRLVYFIVTTPMHSRGHAVRTFFRSVVSIIMERWTGKVALVTGASAGIGEAIARKLVEKGMRVVGCSRNPAKIEARYVDRRAARAKMGS